MNAPAVKARGAAQSGREHWPFRGVLAPVLTPFTPDLQPNRPAFTAFCAWLLEQGADGLAVFGTTSEANSLSLAERMSLLEHLVANGIPGRMLMPGTGAASVPEAVHLTRGALNAGAGGVLVLGHAKRDTLDIPTWWTEKKMLKHGDNVMRFLIIRPEPAAISD